MTRKRLSKEERRHRLLDAARQIFGKKGFAKTEVDDIARGAGVTRPILYRHFPGGKKEVFIEVVNEHLDALLKQLLDAMEASQDPPSRLYRGIEAYLAFAEQNPEGYYLLINSSEEIDSEIARRPREVRGEIVQTLSATIGEVMKGAGLNPEGAPIYAHALLGGVESVITWWAEVKVPDRETLASHLLAFVWRGFDGLPRDPSKFRHEKLGTVPQPQPQP